MPELGQMLGQGTSGQVYRYGEGTVLKLFYPEIPPENIGFEARITSYVNQAGLPAAKVYDIIEHQGRTGIVYQNLEGKALLRILGHQVHRMFYWSKVLAKLHIQMHKCPPPKDLGHQKPLFADWIVAASGLDTKTKDKVLKYLDLMPSGTQLCHNDLQPDNIVLTAAGLVVIDWTYTRIGDALADAAYTMLMLQIGEVPAETGGQNGIAFGRMLFSRLYARDYLRESGFGTLPEMLKWRMPLAAARLIYKFPREKQPCINIVQGEIKKMEKRGVI